MDEKAKYLFPYQLLHYSPRTQRIIKALYKSVAPANNAFGLVPLFQQDHSKTWEPRK